ncbi:MAG: 16S rRNA (guanine(966)-N(2))-methyltransferase RsmD [Thermoleophilia bacterium]|nr:16S rRNA (guanine(966)-N(2))-methyltransferase RsmD [Thermoleophilia bacterium]
MRIIAGTNKGAAIYAPPGEKTRPTADKVRGAIFNILGPVEGLKVLDLFAGSGALGLEALSRGAASATLVDNRDQALKTIARNITKLKPDNAHPLRRDYLGFLKDAAKKGERYDLIFVDPPYKMHRVVEPELGRWLPGVVSEGGRVVIESDARQEVTLPGELLREKVYGDTRVSVFRFSGPARSLTP